MYIVKIIFKFEFIFPKDYPYSPPSVRLTNNFNFDLINNGLFNSSAEVCFGFLTKQNWRPMLS